MANIYNYESNTLLSGTSGNDSIYNGGSDVTINAGAGDDSIENRGDSVTIDAGAGDDSIDNEGAQVSITAGAGDDEIYNYYGSNDTINAGAGDDSIDNYGFNVSINAGSGNDYISNYSDGDSVTIDAGDGKDSINNQGNNVSITAGDGNDYIYSNSYWDGSKYVGADNVSINGGAGDDYIWGFGTGAVYFYKLGDGNDRIAFGAFDTLVIEGATYSTQKSGSDILVTVGDNVITLEEAANISEPSIVSTTANVVPVNFIDNGKENVNVKGKSTANYINNSAGNVTITGGKGKDYVFNSGESVSVLTWAGNDSVQNQSRNVSINAGDGKDSIRNEGSNVSINGGDGDDTIYNTDYWDGSRHYPDNVTINAGAGDDSIDNYGSNVSISAGDGNDSIQNSGSNVSISAGDGKDFIWNDGSQVLIDGGEGNDTIDNDGASVSVDAGEGDDEIWNDGSNVTINAGDGNDSIRNDYGSNVTINAGAGNDSIWNKGYDGGGQKILADGGDGNDYIYNWQFTDTTLSGGDGNDTIQNNGSSNVSISGGAGNDSISNSGASVSVDAGDGNDTIYNAGYWDGSKYVGADNVSIKGGAGDDYIWGFGTGAVYFYKLGDGNDRIAFGAFDTLVIEGATYSTQKSGSDILVTVGDNVITLEEAANISEPSIVSTTANVVPVNFIDNGKENVNVKGKSTANYINNSAGNVTITGGKGKDYVFNSGESVSVLTWAGNDSVQNQSRNVSINAGDGKDSIRNEGGSNVLIDSGAGNDTIHNEKYWDGSKYFGADNVTINAGAGNDLIYNGGGDEASVSNNVSISGGAGNDSITNTGAKILFTYAEGDGNDIIAGFNETSTLSITGGTYSTDFVGDDLIVTVGKGKITLVGAASLESININDEKIFSYSWTLDGTVATYGSASKTLATVSGVKSLNGISLSGKVVTVSKAALNAADISVSDGYTLALASDVPAPTTAKATYSDGVYKTAGISKAGYQLSGNSIRYVTADIKTIKFSGVADDVTASNFYVSGNTITVGKAAVKTNGTALKLLTSGYTLKLGNGMAAPTTSKAWSLDGTTAAYQQTTTAGYKLADNSITYSKAATKNLITVSGVKSLDGLKLSKKIVTVSAASLGTKDVSISDGYTLKLGSDVSKPSTSKAWSLDGTTAAYQQTTSAGYTLADNAISYSKAATKNLITVSGVADDATVKNFYLSGTSITVGKAAVKTDGTALKLLTSGYTLKLGNGMAAPTTSKAWSLDGTTAAYQQTTSAGYKLADNAIAYSKKSSKTLVTVDGVDSLDGLKLSKKVVTVSAASLGTSDVTISDGYKLKLGKDVDAPTSKQAAWTLKKTTATYKSSSTTAGYTLEDNVIRYSKKKSASTLATIKGVENVDGLSISGKMISAEATALSKKVTVSSDDYGFDFGTDYKKARVTGSEFDDKIKSAGQRVTILGGAGDDSLVGSGKYSSLSGGDGKDTIISGGNGSTLNGGAGNDLLTGSGEEDIFVYAAGDGNDTITNYDTSDKISLASGAAKISVSLGAVVFKVGSGKLTLKNAADLKVTYIDADGTEHTYPEEQNPVEFNAKGTGATLTTAYTEETFDINGYRDYKDSVVTINASAVLHPLDITGNNLANVITGTSEDDYIYGEDGGDKIFGGEGNDSLWGGAGNDTLTGDSGSNVFIFYDGDGDDLIKDYESGIDTVMIMSGTVSNPIVDGRDVIFSVGDGQITFEDAASKPIVLVNRNGKQVGSHTPK